MPITDDGIWLINISNEPIQAPDTVTIAGITVLRSDLKSKHEVLGYLAEHGENLTTLSECFSCYLEKYDNELFWHYPISDELHAGAYFVPVREGFLSIPYNSIDTESYEVLYLEDAKLLDEASIRLLWQDWTRFSADLQAAMQDMLNHLTRS